MSIIDPMDVLRLENEALKTALQFSCLSSYQDCNTSRWPSSSLENMRATLRDTIGKDLDYEVLFKDECGTHVQRLGFTKLLIYGGHPFTDQGISKFIAFCKKQKDQICYDLLKEQFPDIEEEL
jgi:hypothetical protein